MDTPNIKNIDVHDLAKEIKSGKYGDLESVANLARVFRQKADDSEMEFMLFLRAFDLSGLWALVDSGTFEQFIDRNHICSPVRYRAGVHTLDIVPKPVIELVSFAAAREIAKVADGTRRKQAIKTVCEWAKQNKRPPSAQKARDLIGLKPTTHVSEPLVDRLQRENVMLRAENKRLRAMVKKLGGDPDSAARAA